MGPPPNIIARLRVRTLSRLLSGSEGGGKDRGHCTPNHCVGREVLNDGQAEGYEQNDRSAPAMQQQREFLFMCSLMPPLSAPNAAEPSTMPLTQRLTCTIDDACEVTGMGRTKLYELIGVDVSSRQRSDVGD